MKSPPRPTSSALVTTHLDDVRLQPRRRWRLSSFRNYLAEKLLPTTVRDRRPGRCKLVKMGVELGHEGNPDLVCGVACGEHGGDPDSVKTFHKIGLDYVSCSLPRAVACLAAAQAAIADKQ